MLSDACAEFITTLIEGETNHKAAVKQLAEDIERYSGPRDYVLGEISRLREACAAVLSTPAGANNGRSAWLGRLVNLVVIAEQVRAYYDTRTPRISDAWIKAMDDVRCLEFEDRKDVLAATRDDSDDQLSF